MTIARARLAADDPRRFAVRLAGTDDSVASRVATWLPNPRNAGPLGAAASLAEQVGDTTGDDAARLAGLMHFLGGDYKQASDKFRSIRQKTARDWNDFAATELALAQKTGRHDHTLEGLAAADRAMQLSPTMKEARFNRTVAIEHLGALPVALAQWRQLPAIEPASPWAGIAHRKAAGAETEAAAWRKHDVACVTPGELRDLASRFPQQARVTAESILLSTWAEAMLGNEREARHQLELARTVGEVLRGRDESLLADAVAAIEGAEGTPRMQKLIAAHLAYREGRLALSNENIATAERLLRIAREDFRAGGSPMADMAACYAATAIANQDRPAEALAILNGLRASASVHHKTLRARIDHELANWTAVLGHWSESIAAAERSMAVSSAHREQTHLAATQATLGETYDFVGSTERAWQHGSSALRTACTAGDYARARVALAVLTRTEMRGRRWPRARALASVEQELALYADAPRLNAGLFLRLATIDSHLGRRSDADRAIAQARVAAKILPRKSAREKLLADIDGQAGALERPRDPKRAIALLSSAIRFQQQAERSIVLPELYLERGRAYVAAGGMDDAARDFESGIRELERQRNRVHESELRPGIFDDAVELFDEAVSLRVRRGDSAAAVLNDIERGRARAVLEQIEATDDMVVPADLADLQRHLAAGTALAEYVALPDRLVILVVKPNEVAMRSVAVPRTNLVKAANTFVQNVESAAASGALYDLLIRPMEADLGDVDALTFVVPDFLQRVPFGALRARGAQSFLIERRATALSPSAGVFIATVQRLQQLPPTQPRSVGVFANPTIPRDKFPQLPSLRTSESEGRMIGKQYPKSDVFTREAATAMRFIELAPSYDVVHYAGHATLDRHEPAQSALVCASTPDMHGALTLRQIARMRFRSTRVVVLAACSTMDGRNAAVEGVPSLSRAFLVAGVPAVVGTLWDIEDGEAIRIMRPFHERLAHGTGAAEALRAAQIDALRAGLPVRQWAAFALTGSAR
ncbi:MAG TPA: CHAT domain-containing protein [Thermoanaerobaculia bacterium]